MTRRESGTRLRATIRGSGLENARRGGKLGGLRCPADTVARGGMRRHRPEEGLAMSRTFMLL